MNFLLPKFSSDDIRINRTLLAICVIFLLAATSCGKRKIAQPIQFNHKKHVVENKLECSECHTTYLTGATSGRPTVEICSMCHAVQLGESAEEAKLVSTYVEPEKEIPWKRIFRTRKDVYYSHRRHVALGELECKQCHGDIGNMTKPPSRPVVMAMKTCIGCHRKRQVTEDCVACHR